MKTIKYILITTALFVQSNIFLFAQNTEGREFWVTFGLVTTIAIGTDMRIRVVGGNEATSGTIFFTNLGTAREFHVEPYEIYTYVLENFEKIAVYNLTMGITNHSIRVSTLKPVTVYAHIGANTNSDSDATNVLPVTALGTKYYNFSYRPYPALDAYAVVATKNNTHLYHNGILEATLNAGEVYYRTSSTDMTGALITSDNLVALFATIQRTQVPGGYGGILFQQIAPVNTWSNSFFVPVTIVGIERVRIVASQNGTNITQIGGVIKTELGGQPSLTDLQAGQFVELEITLGNNGCYIYANHPVGVCSYMRSGGLPYPNTSCSQTWVPGIEQTISKVIMAPFENLNYYESHYALVFAPTEARDKTMVSIGGAAPVYLNDENWIENDSSGMSFISYQLTNLSASYIFSNSNKMMVFSYAQGGIIIQSTASYCYLAGSAMRDLQATFYANDIPYQILTDNPICDDFVTFKAETKGLHTSPGRIKWFIDGEEEVTKRDSLKWSKPFSQGAYEIRMWCRYENEDTVSKTGILKIEYPCVSAAFYANNVHHSELKDTTFCNKTVNFRAEVEGQYNLKWYINNAEETSLESWSKTFENNGNYTIKLVINYETGKTETLVGTLKIQALWIKMRNVTY